MSVCALQAELLDLRTYNLAQILKTIKSQRSLKVKVKGQGHQGKNVKILVFSLVSEKMVQDQGHKDQDQGHRGIG